jgi:hypothetical protein
MAFPIKPLPTQEEIVLPRFAVVGRPNAGKSSIDRKQLHCRSPRAALYRIHSQHDRRYGAGEAGQ